MATKETRPPGHIRGYCMRCRQPQNVPIASTSEVAMRNGRAARRGPCPACGTMLQTITNSRAARPPNPPDMPNLPKPDMRWVGRAISRILEGGSGRFLTLTWLEPDRENPISLLQAVVEDRAGKRWGTSGESLEIALRRLLGESNEPPGTIRMPQLPETRA